MSTYTDHVLRPRAGHSSSGSSLGKERKSFTGLSRDVHTDYDTMISFSSIPTHTPAPRLMASHTQIRSRQESTQSRFCPKPDSHCARAQRGRAEHKPVCLDVPPEDDGRRHPILHPELQLALDGPSSCCEQVFLLEPHLQGQQRDNTKLYVLWKLRAE